MAGEKQLFSGRGKSERLETLSAEGRDARLHQEVRGYWELPAELHLCKGQTIKRRESKRT